MTTPSLAPLRARIALLTPRTALLVAVCAAGVDWAACATPLHADWLFARPHVQRCCDGHGACRHCGRGAAVLAPVAISPPPPPLIAPRSRFAPAPTRPVFEPQHTWFATAMYESLDQPTPRFIVPPAAPRFTPDAPRVLEEPIPVPAESVPGVEWDALEGWRPAELPPNTPVQPTPQTYIPYNMPHFHQPPIGEPYGGGSYSDAPYRNAPYSGGVLPTAPSSAIPYQPAPIHDRRMSGDAINNGWSLPQERLPNIRQPQIDMPILTPIPGALPRGKMGIPRMQIPTMPMQPLPHMNHHGQISPAEADDAPPEPPAEVLPASHTSPTDERPASPISPAGRQLRR